jgi:hypothetical protein
MSKTPDQTSATLVENQPFLDIRNARIEAATLDSLTRDDANTITTQLRKGLVVGESGSDAGKYVDAGDATVQTNVAANVSALETADSGWQSATITASIAEEGVSVTVTLGGADDTDAEVVIALNANEAFNAHFIATAPSGVVLITAIRTGPAIKVISSLATAYGAAGVSGSPTLTKYGLLMETVRSILGIDDAAEDRNVAIITANAIIREDNVPNLTDAARLWFARNGVSFE